jgi:hypothetical protein
MCASTLRGGSDAGAGFVVGPALRPSGGRWRALADDRRLFVQTGPPTLAVVETTAPAGTLAVDDLTDERAPRRLGQLRGDMTPFVVAVGGRRLLVLAGTHGPSRKPSM